MKKLITMLTFVMILALCLAVAGCAQAPAEPPAEPPAEAPVETPAEVEEPAIEYPTEDITIINSSSAGSPADIMARQVAMALEEITGKTVTVENVTGGSGGNMFATVLGEPADGYTIGCVTASQIAALQSGLKDVYSIDQFEFVANTQVDPYCIFVRADSQFTSIEDIAEYAKANPGALQIGGQGTGSALHLCALAFAKGADFTCTWLPSEGGSDTVANVLGGNFMVGMAAPTTVSQYLEANEVRMLAITGDSRLESYPDVPTFNELGYEINLTQYRGFYVQAGTDPAIVEILSDLIDQAAHSESFMQYMADNNLPDGYMNAEDFTAYVYGDFEAVGAMTAELIQ